MSEEIKAAEIRLLDALCTWERATGRGSVLILFREEIEERGDFQISPYMLLAQDGKPTLLAKFYFDFLVKHIRERMGY